MVGNQFVCYVWSYLAQLLLHCSTSNSRFASLTSTTGSHNGASHYGDISSTVELVASVRRCKFPLVRDLLEGFNSSSLKALRVGRLTLSQAQLPAISERQPLRRPETTPMHVARNVQICCESDFEVSECEIEFRHGFQGQVTASHSQSVQLDYYSITSFLCGTAVMSYAIGIDIVNATFDRNVKQEHK